MLITFIDLEADWQKLLPLTYTRPVSDLRVGILKIHEKWSKRLRSEVAFRSVDYLTEKFSRPSHQSLTIVGGLLPTPEVLSVIRSLEAHQCLVHQGKLIAGYFEPDEAFEQEGREAIEITQIERIRYPWDLFRKNGQEIRLDAELFPSNNRIQDPHTITYGAENIIIEDGVDVKAAVLNAENGPIYLGKNSVVSEGCLIKGPFALCEGSIINMGAKMRGDTTIGPSSKVGGEISNSVIQGYSSKGHEGFLGNAVLGEWCNLGADSNNSNLKNNYANVKMWDYNMDRFKDTGLQFCGLIMGDHSKCGINTMFNTGTTIGVSANIFGSGFPRNFIPSFSWGGASGFSTYQLRKVFETVELVMRRRQAELDGRERDILSAIFERSAKYRIWDKSNAV